MMPISRTWHRVPGLIVAAALPVLAALALLPARGTLNLVTDAMVMLLSVAASALIGGLPAGLVSAVWAAVLLNFLFTPPFHTFRVTDPNNVVAIVVFALVAGIVSWAVEQSARRERESVRAASLEAADRVRAAILAAVGHDLRTPLAAAKASVSGLLADDVELSEADQRELLDGADTSLDRLSSLVDNLLDVSRVQAGAMPVVLRPTAVEEVVAQALDDVGLHGQRVRVEVPDDLPPVYADAGLLERVLANLMTNAARFSPADQPVLLCARTFRDSVDVLVVDHGPGVPASRRDDVFQPFQRLGDTSNTEGLGLGLALARGLVEAMKGTLTPRDTPGGGLTMVVSLRQAP
jgi:two-component system, OmpR family, sensor histidine kinase KdpD